MSKKVISASESCEATPFVPSGIAAVPSRPRQHESGRTDAVFADAFSKGYEAGFQQGHADASRDALIKAEMFCLELREIAHRSELAMKVWFQRAESRFSGLAVEIAEKIVASELKLDRSAIISIAKEVVAKVENSVSARVRVNPFDLPIALENKEAILQASSALENIDIIGDDSLSSGSVLIESDNGVIDATLETKFAQVREQIAS